MFLFHFLLDLIRKTKIFFPFGSADLDETNQFLFPPPSLRRYWTPDCDGVDFLCIVLCCMADQIPFRFAASFAGAIPFQTRRRPRRWRPRINATRRRSTTAHRSTTTQLETNAGQTHRLTTTRRLTTARRRARRRIRLRDDHDHPRSTTYKTPR